MKHNGYDLKTTYYGDGYKEVKDKQIEMIRRHYADYSKDDWVLWIVADLFHRNIAKDLTGVIEVKKKDGCLIEVPFMVRTPYPNKRIRQLSMKSGRKRLYGIPLVFKSFESLSEISDITIRWDIYEEWSLNDNEPFELHIKCVIVKYHLSFEKDEQNTDYRFFTVFSKDNTCDIYSKDDGEKADKYYEEFDHALNTTGSVICDGDEWESIISDIYTLKKNSYEEGKELTNEEKNAIDEIYKLTPNKEKTNDLLKNVIVKSELQWDTYFYEKTEVLTATYMADILPGPSFGFLARKAIKASKPLKVKSII